MRLPGASRGVRWSLKYDEDFKRGCMTLRTCAELNPDGFLTAKSPLRLIFKVGVFPVKFSRFAAIK